MKRKNIYIAGQEAAYGITYPYCLLTKDVYLEGINLTLHKGTKFYETTLIEYHELMKIEFKGNNETIFTHENLMINDGKLILNKNYKSIMEFFPYKSMNWKINWKEIYDNNKKTKYLTKYTTFIGGYIYDEGGIIEVVKYEDRYMWNDEDRQYIVFLSGSQIEEYFEEITIGGE